MHPIAQWDAGARVSAHAPLAGSDAGLLAAVEDAHVSTHAPLAGSDSVETSDWRSEMFQPTLPLRGATSLCQVVPGRLQVSTHAPLAGSDHCTPARRWRSRRFNPRSPCGERRVEHRGPGDGIGGFQPTLPLRGATCWRTTGESRPTRFNPRSPCGERPGSRVTGW